MKDQIKQIADALIHYFENFAEHDMSDKMKEVCRKDLTRIISKHLNGEPVGIKKRFCPGCHSEMAIMEIKQSEGSKILLVGYECLDCGRGFGFFYKQDTEELPKQIEVKDEK